MCLVRGFVKLKIVYLYIFGKVFVSILVEIEC